MTEKVVFIEFETSSEPDVSKFQVAIGGQGPAGPQGPKGDVGDVNPQMHTILLAAQAAEDAAASHADTASAAAAAAHEDSLATAVDREQTGIDVEISTQNRLTSVAAADSATVQAGIATEKSAISVTKASEAVAAKIVATEQAAIATYRAGLAGSHADSAEEWAVAAEVHAADASNQKNVAGARATDAYNYSRTAADKANIASAKASAASDSADAAAASEAIAAEKAGIALTAAGSASADKNAVSALLASFRGVFLGDFASDADAVAFAAANQIAVADGLMYQNTVSDKFRIYNGAAWQDYDSTAQAAQSAAQLSAAAAAASAELAGSHAAQTGADVVAAAASKAAAQAAQQDIHENWQGKLDAAAGFAATSEMHAGIAADEANTAEAQAVIAANQAGIATAKASAAAASETAALGYKNTSLDRANAAAASAQSANDAYVQTQYARDQALAGLGAADNSQVLIELLQQITYVTDMALLAVRERDATAARLASLETYSGTETDARVLADTQILQHVVKAADMAGQAVLELAGVPTGVDRIAAFMAAPMDLVGVAARTLAFCLKTVGVPANASAYGQKGDVAVDANNIYICTAANTWKRVAIATW